jgi:hypothetical protein
MKIEGTPKEIADFVVALQSQPTGIEVSVPQISNNNKSIENLLKELVFYKNARHQSL